MIVDSISMRLSGGKGVHRCEYKTLVFKVKNVLRSCEKRGSRKWRRTRLKRTIPGKSRQRHRPSITNLFFFLFLFSIVAVADGQRMFTAGDSEFSLWQFEIFQHIILRIFTLTIWNVWTYFPINSNSNSTTIVLVPIWNVWTYFQQHLRSSYSLVQRNLPALLHWSQWWDLSDVFEHIVWDKSQSRGPLTFSYPL